MNRPLSSINDRNNSNNIKLLMNNDYSYINTSVINNISNDNTNVTQLPTITKNVNVNNFNRPIQKSVTPVKYKKINLKNNNNLHLFNKKNEKDIYNYDIGISNKILNGNFKKDQPKLVLNNIDRSRIKGINALKY
jgi:hypothetical protein